VRLERDDLIIQSVPWQVRVIPAGDSRIIDASGVADFNNYIIFICEDMPPQEQIETLCHEILHILVRGRERVDLSREDDLRVLSVMLCDTLLRNSLSFDLKDDQGW
jgi:hypothetical protein